MLGFVPYPNLHKYNVRCAVATLENRFDFRNLPVWIRIAFWQFTSGQGHELAGSRYQNLHAKRRARSPRRFALDGEGEHGDEESRAAGHGDGDSP